MLSPLVDTEAVFAYDCSLERAVRFAQDGISGVYAQKQATANLLPCSFYGTQKELQPGEALTLYEVIGRVVKEGVSGTVPVGEAGAAPILRRRGRRRSGCPWSL